MKRVVRFILAAELYVIAYGFNLTIAIKAAVDNIKYVVVRGKLV